MLNRVHQLYVAYRVLRVEKKLNTISHTQLTGVLSVGIIMLTTPRATSWLERRILACHWTQGHQRG